MRQDAFQARRRARDWVPRDLSSDEERRHPRNRRDHQHQRGHYRRQDRKPESPIGRNAEHQPAHYLSPYTGAGRSPPQGRGEVAVKQRSRSPVDKRGEVLSSYRRSPTTAANVSPQYRFPTKQRSPHKAASSVKSPIRSPPADTTPSRFTEEQLLSALRKIRGKDQAVDAQEPEEDESWEVYRSKSTKKRELIQAKARVANCVFCGEQHSKEHCPIGVFVCFECKDPGHKVQACPIRGEKKRGRTSDEFRQPLRKREISHAIVSVTGTMRRCKERLRTSMGVIRRVRGWPSTAEVVSGLRHLSDSFNKRHWVLHMINDYWITEFPSADGVLALARRDEIKIVEGRFGISIKPWSGEEGAIQQNLGLPTWITLTGLPMHCWEVGGLQDVVRKFGVVLEVDAATLKKQGAYARVCIACLDSDYIPSAVRTMVENKCFLVVVKVEEQVIREEKERAAPKGRVSKQLFLDDGGGKNAAKWAEIAAGKRSSEVEDDQCTILDPTVEFEMAGLHRSQALIINECEAGVHPSSGEFSFGKSTRIVHRAVVGTGAPLKVGPTDHSLLRTVVGTAPPNTVGPTDHSQLPPEKLGLDAVVGPKDGESERGAVGGTGAPIIVGPTVLSLLPPEKLGLDAVVGPKDGEAVLQAATDVRRLARSMTTQTAGHVGSDAVVGIDGRDFRDATVAPNCVRGIERGSGSGKGWGSSHPNGLDLAHVPLDILGPPLQVFSLPQVGPTKDSISTLAVPQAGLNSGIEGSVPSIKMPVHDEEDNLQELLNQEVEKRIQREVAKRVKAMLGNWSSTTTKISSGSSGFVNESSRSEASNSGDDQGLEEIPEDTPSKEVHTKKNAAQAKEGFRRSVRQRGKGEKPMTVKEIYQRVGKRKSYENIAVLVYPNGQLAVEH